MTGDGAHLVDVDVSGKLINISKKMMYSYIPFCLFENFGCHIINITQQNGYLSGIV